MSVHSAPAAAETAARVFSEPYIAFIRLHCGHGNSVETMARTIIYYILSISTLAYAVNATDSQKTQDNLGSTTDVSSIVDIINKIISLFDINVKEQASKDTTEEDTSFVAQTCGPAPSACEKSRYRSFGGTCNNLQNPNWGAAKEPFGELVDRHRPDNINISAQGNLLPNPREISVKVFPPRNFVDHKWTLNTMQWGQILAHDLSLAASTSLIGTPAPSCCNNKGQYTSESDTNRFCAAIAIPSNDSVYSADKRECFNFVRTVTTKDTDCTAAEEPSYPINESTGYVDLSLVYGVNDTLAKSLREGKGGRMLTTKRNGGVWPPQAANAQETCSPILSPNDTCYVAGDFRINQNPELAVLQTMLLKEHNRIADTLSQINGHWDDETIYQETRRILIAMCQYINYNEFLPILLGRDYMLDKKLIYKNPKSYINDYDSNMNAAILNEFATAAYRYFHTLIYGRLDMIKENRDLMRSIRLSDWFNRPSVIEEKNAFDGLARGLCFQPQDKADQYFDKEITQYLFRGNNKNGADLRAIDIQRGRDHRLASYVALRQYCGLSKPKTFDDLSENISKRNIEALKSLYKTVEDIDLTVGGALEELAPGALMGPTYLCISLIQFYNIRVGDRFFYENGQDKNIAFTPSQLDTIRKGTSMARLVCDNGINIKYMQPRAFELVSSDNELVPCNTLPSVDLSLWKEAKQEESKPNKNNA